MGAEMKLEEFTHLPQPAGHVCGFVPWVSQIVLQIFPLNPLLPKNSLSDMLQHSRSNSSQFRAQLPSAHCQHPLFDRAPGLESVPVRGISCMDWMDSRAVGSTLWINTAACVTASLGGCSSVDVRCTWLLWPCERRPGTFCGGEGTIRSGRASFIDSISFQATYFLQFSYKPRNSKTWHSLPCR